MFWHRNKRPPTDFELLKAIYERHHAEYLEVAATGDHGRILVPVNIPAVAESLGSDQDMVFGRLYYYLERKHGEDWQPGRPRRAFFVQEAEDKVNAVNFPLLEAVLAGLWDERDRERRTFRISVLSILIAVGSLGLAAAAILSS